MAFSIFDLITSKGMKAYLDNNAKLFNKQPHTFEKFFPRQDKRGVKIEWLLDNIKLSRLGSLAAFDQPTPFRGYDGVETKETKIPYFLEGKRMQEEDMMKLADLVDVNPNKPAIQEIIRKVYRQGSELVEGMYDVAEYMRAKLLTTYAFTLQSANEFGAMNTANYNYDPDGSIATANTLTLTGTDKWSDTTNSDPIKDILEIENRAGDRGLEIEEIVMGKDTWNYFLTNAKVKNYIAGSNIQPNYVLTKEDVMKVLLTRLGHTVNIVVNKEKYLDWDDTEKNYYPQNSQVTFICRSALGNTYYGITPMEISNELGSTSARDITRRDGIVLSTYWKQDPEEKIVRVAQSVLPSFEGIKAVYNIKWAVTPVTYTVTYDGNGNTAGTVPTAQTVNAGSSVTISAGTGLQKSGKAFRAWKLNGSDVSGSLTPTGNVTLVADYEV